MDCRCGHSFCWLCLQPLSVRCACPQFGGRRTADARARLSSPGWRRAVLLSAEASSLRVLALAICCGVGLHRTDAVGAILLALYNAAVAAPTLSKLAVAQAALGAVQLASSRASLRAMPRRIYQRISMRQVDLCCGGAGTDMIIGVLSLLERLHCLHPLPAYAAARLPFRLLSRATALILGRHRPDLSQRHSPPASREMDAIVRLQPSVRDPPPARLIDRSSPYHDHRPFGRRSNFAGYLLSRRCRAALPAVAAVAFAGEVMLPAVAPALIFAFLRLLKCVLLVPLGALSALFVNFAELVEPWRPDAPSMATDAEILPFISQSMMRMITSPWTVICAALHHCWMPSIGAYLSGVVAVIFVVGALSCLCFLCNVAAIISLLSTLRESGVRRRVAARLAADPEAELEELEDDGELTYSIEDLRLDMVRALLDTRTLLFYAHTLLEAERFSAELWADLDTHVGASGVFARRFALCIVPNLFCWLQGMRLPTTAVCLNALIAHLEPVTLSWCSQWTGPHWRPTSELLSHGFELLRLYAYLGIILPAMSLMLLHSCLPAAAAAWLASDAPYGLIPARETLISVGVRTCMALDGAAILYALVSFRAPRNRALLIAATAFGTLLPAVLATAAFPSFATAHRALLYAALPPFAALIGTLAPFLRPRPTAPTAAGTLVAAAAAERVGSGRLVHPHDNLAQLAAAAAAAAAAGGPPLPAALENHLELPETDDENASEYDDENWDPVNNPRDRQEAPARLRA